MTITEDGTVILNSFDLLVRSLGEPTEDLTCDDFRVTLHTVAEAHTIKFQYWSEDINDYKYKILKDRYAL